VEVLHLNWEKIPEGYVKYEGKRVKTIIMVGIQNKEIVGWNAYYSEREMALLGEHKKTFVDGILIASKINKDELEKHIDGLIEQEAIDEAISLNSFRNTESYQEIIKHISWDTKIIIGGRNHFKMFMGWYGLYKVFDQSIKIEYTKF
jgi:hypothetical protein